MIYKVEEVVEEGNANEIFSKRIRAGSRRTYFLDVRTTKSNDYYLTITESKKRFNNDGYERHKVFLYKEDFNKFIEALNETINFVKTELLPDYDFDEYSHKDDEYYHKSKPPTEDKPETKVEESETSAPPKETAEKAEELLGEQAVTNTTNSDSKVTQEADDLKWD